MWPEGLELSYAFRLWSHAVSRAFFCDEWAEAVCVCGFAHLWNTVAGEPAGGDAR